jgi:hypothetical protein
MRSPLGPSPEKPEIVVRPVIDDDFERAGFTKTERPIEPGMYG